MDVVVGVQLIKRDFADVLKEEEVLVCGFGKVEHHLLHIDLIGEVVEGIIIFS